MSPEHQHLASIANLLSHLDGSITRVCVECGAIFKLGPGSEQMFCSACQLEREENACCDGPAHRTIRSASHEDGTTFATVVCDNCGYRYETEL